MAPWVSPTATWKAATLSMLSTIDGSPVFLSVVAADPKANTRPHARQCSGGDAGAAFCCCTPVGAGFSARGARARGRGGSDGGRPGGARGSWPVAASARCEGLGGRGGGLAGGAREGGADIATLTAEAVRIKTTLPCLLCGRYAFICDPARSPQPFSLLDHHTHTGVRAHMCACTNSRAWASSTVACSR